VRDTHVRQLDALLTNVLEVGATDAVRSRWATLKRVMDFFEADMRTRYSDVDVPEFATGGLVPGAVGAPLMALVHGGEVVLPVDLVDTLRRSAQPWGGPAPLGAAISQSLVSALRENTAAVRATPVQMTVSINGADLQPMALGQEVVSAISTALRSNLGVRAEVKRIATSKS